MNFNKTDLLHAQNLLRAIKKAQHTLDGLEAIALSEALRWLANLNKVIEDTLNAPPVQVSEIKSPVSEPVKDSSNKGRKKGH